MLHGGGSDENMYLDQNNKQILKLAEEHGYILVSPLGYSRTGAYGTCLRLPAVFGQPEEAKKMIDALTPDRLQLLENSEKDVINVLEIVLNEYPVDRDSIFLTGHSMGSGGTWYLGAKYSRYWAAIAPMSGPFVDKDTYLWDNIRDMPIFMTENLRDTGYGKCVGEDNKHLRITVTQTNRENIVCIGFGLGDKMDVISNKKPFKAVYSIDENEWNGNVSLQLKLRDIKA